MALVCSQCARPMPAATARFNRRYLGQWVCSRECGHAAGDRSGCPGWNCGCTGYAKRRRWLRDHRVNMRIMDDLIWDNGLEDELEDRLVQETGNTNFFLGLDAELDEASEDEDPEQKQRATIEGLRAEAADQSTMLQAVQGALECRDTLLDLERARMELEDLRSRQMRALLAR